MYILVKKNHKCKTDGIIELIGYETKINKYNIVIYNQKISDILIKAKLMPEFNKLVKKILIFLEEDGDGDNAAYLLDELARVYALFLNKYERFLSKYEKEQFMKNLRVLTNELKSLTRKKSNSILSVSKGRSK